MISVWWPFIERMLCVSVFNAILIFIVRKTRVLQRTALSDHKTDFRFAKVVVVRFDLRASASSSV